jgi:serine/threonine-protein kinase
MQVFAEAKRRGVLKVATVYLALAWLTLEVGHTLFNIFELPHVGLQLVFVLLALGFPVILGVAWHYPIGRSSPHDEGAHQEQHSHHEGAHVAAVFFAVALFAIATAIGVRFFHFGGASGHGSHAAAHAPSEVAGAATAPVAEAQTPASFKPPEHSIAVLPFVNLSGDPREDYFSDGLSEELLNSMTRVEQLKVAARTSSFSFKGAQTDIPTIARKLNVGAVLEGSVRKDGSRVRIAAELIDAMTGYHLWSRSYDRDLRDIFALQSEIAESVTHSLRVTLLKDAQEVFELGGTQSSEAFDGYLHALKLREGVSKEDVEARIATLARVVELDPHYALAYASHSDALMTYAVSFADRPHEAIMRAKSSAQKAIELAPNLGEGHAALGRVLDFGALDFSGALREHQLAMKLTPGSADVVRLYANFLASLGRPEAVEVARTALALDPLSLETYRVWLRALLYTGHYPELIESVTNTHMSGGLIRSALGRAYLALGRNQEAIDACLTEPVVWFRAHCLAIAYHRVGRQHDAETALRELQADSGDTAAFQYAEIYAQWGKPDDAVKWLRRAYELRDPGLPVLDKDAFLEPIRGRPEFKAIHAALKFPDA